MISDRLRHIIEALIEEIEATGTAELFDRDIEWLRELLA